MFDVDVDAVVMATGFKLFEADNKPEYGYGKFKNVITGHADGSAAGTNQAVQHDPAPG